MVEPFSYSLDWDGDGAFDVVDSPATSHEVPAELTDDGPATLTVTARITNRIGRSTEYSTDVVVVNEAPALTVTGPATAAAGDTVALSLTAEDASAADVAAGFTYRLDWDGDGTVDQTLTGPAQRSVLHTFPARARSPSR